MSVPAAYLGVILIWSTTPLAVKWSSEGPGFLFGVSARMLLGTVLCLLILRVMRVRLPWHRQARRTYLASSVGIYGAMLSTYWGAQYIPSGLVSVLFGLTPLLTAVFAALLLGERSLTPARVAGIVLGIGGLALIFRTELRLDPSALYGILALVGAATLHSASMVMVKRVGAELPALTVNGGGLVVASTLYVLTWLAVGGHLPTAIPTRAALSIAYLGVFGTLLGFSLYFYALRNLSASHIGLIPLITPVTALLLGQYLNGERVDNLIWAGAALISSGLVLHQWGDQLMPRRAVVVED
jgi:drug/metabolite transporter (DMT)-like permease